MAWTPSAVAVVVFGSAAVAAGVGLSALRRRPDPLAWPLAVMTFGIVAWAVPHAISFGYADVERVAFWHRMRYPGTVIAPVAYLVVALRYAGYERWLSRRTYAALAVVPVVTVAVVWTNPLHGLFWDSLSVARVGRASVLVEGFGPWYWVNLGYLYLATGAAVAVLGTAAFRSGTVYGKQAALMFVGGAVPLATNVVVTFVFAPGETVDFTTTALTVTGVTTALAVFHLDLLDVRPVARDRVFDELDDGVVVVGPGGRIRDYNPTAASVLDGVAVDRSADAVFPSDVAVDGGELRVDTGNGERRFRTRSTALTDPGGREAGRIVYLNDVTEIVEREQRISVLNRVLRHNIRNELNVVVGCLESIEERLPADDRDPVETALASTRQVIEFAERARHVERTLRAGDATAVVPTPAVVERVVERARAEHPDAVVAYTAPDGSDDGTGASARVVDEDLFEMAVAELVDNGIAHNDRETPRVSVRVEEDGGRVRVIVADDGPGLPEEERRVLGFGAETQLDHGSGLGLWLVKWTASLSAGTLSFDEHDPRGSVVTLSLQAAGR